MLAQKRRGFTLLELLVLVIIIAVNLGLLVLGVDKVHNAALRAKSNPDIKQTVPSSQGQYRLAKVG